MQPAQRSPGWRAYETRGQPIHAHGREVTPIGRVTRISWPGGGLIWNRAVAVEVRQGSETIRLPIHNATRRAIALLLLGLAATTLLLAWVQQRLFLTE